MASTIAAPTTTTPHLLSNASPIQAAQSELQSPRSHDVIADFNYYKDPGDGSPPAPSFVGRPETYERPAETRAMLVRNIRREEDRYSLDGTGFQVYKHVSRETAFVDDEKIKREYYPEVEEILKSA